MSIFATIKNATKADHPADRCLWQSNDRDLASDLRDAFEDVEFDTAYHDDPHSVADAINAQVGDAADANGPWRVDVLDSDQAFGMACRLERREAGAAGPPTSPTRLSESMFTALGEAHRHEIALRAARPVA